MHQLLQQYLPMAVFFGISSVLSLVIITLPRLLAYTKYNKAKLETYECGFAPFGDARSKFDVRFYLVAILFIIFDLEVTFLMPWAITPWTNRSVWFFFYDVFFICPNHRIYI